MEKKRSKGVTILAILLILELSLDVLGLKLSEFKVLHQPLSKEIIGLLFSFRVFIISIALISSIGLFWLKSIFKEIIMFWALYTLLNNFVLIPFVMVKNLKHYFLQTVLRRVAALPEVSAGMQETYLWTEFIAGAVFLEKSESLSMQGQRFQGGHGRVEIPFHDAFIPDSACFSEYRSRLANPCNLPSKPVAARPATNSTISVGSIGNLYLA